MSQKPDLMPRPSGRAPGLPPIEHVFAATDITVTGLEVMADIGVYDHEVGALQPLLLNVRLQIAPIEHDRIGETFDYTNVLEIAQTLASQRISLIETFAHRLARACLSNVVVVEAEVEVTKPRALPGCLAGARVKLRRAIA